MLLRDIGLLLPYHNQLDPDDLVNAINHLIDEVSNRKTIFYDIHRG